MGTVLKYYAGSSWKMPTICQKKTPKQNQTSESPKENCYDWRTMYRKLLEGKTHPPVHLEAHSGRLNVKVEWGQPKAVWGTEGKMQ